MRTHTKRALHIEGFDFASYLAAAKSDSEESAGQEGYADHATSRQHSSVEWRCRRSSEVEGGGGKKKITNPLGLKKKL